MTVFLVTPPEVMATAEVQAVMRSQETAVLLVEAQSTTRPVTLTAQMAPVSNYAPHKSFNSEAGA